MKKILIVLVALVAFGKSADACSPYTVPPLVTWDLTGDILTMDYISETAWGCDYNIVLEITCLDGTIVETLQSDCVFKPNADPLAYPSPTFTLDLTTMGLCSDQTYQFRAKEAPCGSTIGGSAWTGFTTFVFDAGGGPGAPMDLTMDADTIEVCLGDDVNLGCEVTNNCTPVDYTWDPGGLSGEDVTVTPPLGTTTYTVTVEETGVCGTTLTDDIVVIVNDVPVPGIATAVPDELCEGESATITLTGSNGDIQWQSGPSDTGPWTDIAGETTTTLVTGPLTEDTWFQAEVTTLCGTVFSQEFIDVHPNPVADFEFEIDGVSSADGLTGGCYVKEVSFIDGSGVSAPGTITDWAWSFGDGNFSSDENPTHTYAGPGTYTVTLTVTTDGGCVSVFQMVIIMTDSPIVTIIQNDPTCYGFNDGSFTVLVFGGTGSGATIFELEDSDGSPVNIDGSNAANSLVSGTYTWYVDDDGCEANGTVVIDNPDSVVIDPDINHVLCNGDNTGYVTIDTITGWQGDWDQIVYEWSSGPPGGIGADSDTLLTAGEYTVSVTDDFGCAAAYTFNITEPPLLEFSEIGYEPAFCRLYGYQSGNGQVFAAAVGGTPDYTYLWTKLGSTPLQTSVNTTWGGLNPGDYEMVVTDANGCVLTQVVTLDSVNPTPILDIASTELNGNMEGTATVCIELENNSLYFANENNPIADTSFWLSMDYPTVPKQLFQDDDFFLTFDTCYTEGGTYDVCLWIQNKNGCEDSVCHTITVFDPLEITPPNVFTPDGDGVNDVFTFEFLSKGVREFQCIIVNRWGVKMAEINDIAEGWDGTDRGGDACRDGTYFYIYSGEAENGELFEGQGNIQIIGSQK